MKIGTGMTDYGLFRLFTRPSNISIYGIFVRTLWNSNVPSPLKGEGGVRVEVGHGSRPPFLNHTATDSTFSAERF